MEAGLGYNTVDRVASAYANEHGWTTPVIYDGQLSEDGTNGAQVTVNGADGEPALHLTLVPVPATGYWAVSSATTFEPSDDVSLSVGITKDPGQPDVVACSYADAKTAALDVAYGSQAGFRGDTAQMPPQWSFEVGAPDIPGAITITWRDVNGRVVALSASSIPAGDFAAG